MSLRSKPVFPNFSYHYPTDEEYEDSNNWFVNFESNTVWVDGIDSFVPLIIDSREDGVYFGIILNTGDNKVKWARPESKYFNGLRKEYEKYIERILLESPSHDDCTN